MDNEEITEGLKDLNKRTTEVEKRLSYVFGVGAACCILLAAIFSLMSYIYVHETSPIKVIGDQTIHNTIIIEKHSYKFEQVFSEIDRCFLQIQEIKNEIRNKKR